MNVTNELHDRANALMQEYPETDRAIEVATGNAAHVVTASRKAFWLAVAVLIARRARTTHV